MNTCFTVIGVLCLVLAAGLLLRRFRALVFGAVAVGTVVGHEARTSEDSLFHLPVVAFVDEAGNWHRFTSVAGGAAKAPPLETRVVVRYLPSDPSIAYIAGFLHMWAAPVALFVLGAAGASVWWQAW